ncbi:MAG: hypothetical protein H3Z51_08845 [archaeon]|nr:hypothetical protein [archaeon]
MEIWLPYGQVEVAVNIRAENLEEVLEPSMQKLDDRSLSERLNSIEITEKSMIILSDVTRATLRVLNSFIDLQIEKGRSKNLIIAVEKNHLKAVKKALEEKFTNIIAIGEPLVNVGIADGSQVKLPKAFLEYRRMIISEVSFNPLFGFGGGPVSLIKVIDPRLVEEAFKRRLDENPKPGLDTNSAWFASRVSEEVGEFFSIEVLNTKGEVSDVFLGNIVDAHSKASKALYESAKKVLRQPARAMFISLSDPSKSLTLSSSIKSLWNVIGGLGEKGIVALLAECPEGLGSEALRLYVSNRLRLDEFVKHGKYMEGFEDLIYLKNALQSYNIILISTLPNYYSETRLGLRTFKKASDALNYMISSLGARVKLYVIVDAFNTLLMTQSR